MIDTLLQFFYMGGHGLYVWGAYGSVIFLLFIQWLGPWWRWQKYLRKQNNSSSCQSMTHHE